MKVILSADVPELGSIGDVVKVKDGYARNYLIPKKLAVVATTRNIKEFEHTKQKIEAKRRREKETAAELAQRLEKAKITIKAKVGEEERLFGSVTTAMIAEALTAQGFSIDKRKIHLAEPIRTTGVFSVPIKVHAEVTAEIKVLVASDSAPVTITE